MDLRQNCEIFCTKVMKENPMLYKKFSNLTFDYQREKNSSSVQSYYEKLIELFHDDNSLIQEINLCLTNEAQINLNDQDDNQEFQMINAKSLQEDFYIKKSKQKQDLQQKTEVYNKNIKLQKDEYNSQEISENSLKSVPIKKQKINIDDHYVQKNIDQMRKVQYYFHDPNVHHTKEMHNEIIFFDTLRQRFMNEINNPLQFDLFFGEFMKTLKLFYESVINLKEFTDMLNDCVWLEKDYIDELLGQIHIRSTSRRNYTNIFKPLKDTDFSHSQRLTRSYVLMHSGYAKNSHYNHLLNQTWVSVPFGSEDYSFSIMRKNHYEEQLFKSEDERYDYDLYILSVQRTMKSLQQIIDTKDPDKCQSEISKITNMKTIQVLYHGQSDYHLEVIQNLQMDPIKTAKVIIKSFQSKYQESYTNRNTKAKQIWEQVYQTNFLRSLDHRSFYFKRNDKLFTMTQRFLKEPEDKLKIIMRQYGMYHIQEPLKKKGEIQISQFEASQVTQYTNSLVLLTNVQPSLPSRECDLIPQPDINNCLSLPLFILWFGDREILKETLQYILHYTWIIGGSNIREKKYITRTIVKISNSLFNQALVPLDFNQLCLNEIQLRQEVKVIEQKINHYNYNANNIVDDQFTQDKKRKNEINIQSPGSSPKEEEPPIGFNPDTLLDATSDQRDQQELQNSIFPEAQFERSNDLVNQIPQGEGLYVNQPVYVVLRFILCIYQRMELAYQISGTLDANEDCLQIEEEERKDFQLKRFKLFKSAFLLSLKVKDFKYEEYLGCLFGKLGFLFSTLEKLLHDTCKQLAQSHTTRITSSLFQYSLKKIGDSKTYYKSLYNGLQIQSNLVCRTNEIDAQIIYSIDSAKNEDMQLANLTYQMTQQQERNIDKPIFRILFKQSTLFISVIFATSRIQDKTELMRSLGYIQHMIDSISHNKRVFLNRNLRRACRPRQTVSQNRIEWTIGESFKMNLLTDGNEDDMQVINKKITQSYQRRNNVNKKDLFK